MHVGEVSVKVNATGCPHVLLPGTPPKVDVWTLRGLRGVVLPRARRGRRRSGLKCMMVLLCFQFDFERDI